MALQHAFLSWNNFDHARLTSQWAFLVLDTNTPIGYMLDEFVDALGWHKTKSDLHPEGNPNFEVDTKSKTIRLKPSSLNGELIIDSCNRALEEFCEMYQHHPAFAAGLKPWCTQKNQSVKHHMEIRDLGFHPVLAPDKELRRLQVPSPARGIFGILTAGVHLNVYSVKIEDGLEKIDQIWVSQRSDQATFPGCFDQIVAGAMDLEDNFDPSAALGREAQEEAGWQLDIDCKSMHQRNKVGVISKIGDVKDSEMIYFCTKKDEAAGIKEAGHIEPGIRFCYDLKLMAKVTPSPAKDNKAIGRFFSRSVNQVIKSLEAKEWKSSSGLVMMEFLRRHGCISNEAYAGSDGRHPPFSLPEFSHWKVDRQGSCWKLQRC
ncbi:unnamed protein product [Clonostachys chloroleuca]|uniref:Nudix hydrolase domain-containing protein n=1 Tax=Clonostachys chloroleuca TaxID=1926264 RepID=A0AA35MF11_9HYPO|nr:unnamed protein product [Clonostachys chloroleuca]